MTDIGKIISNFGTANSGHPHMPGVVPGTVVICQLVNGQPIVGQVDTVDEEYLLLIQPYSLMMQRGSGGRIQVGMLPYGVDVLMGQKSARAFAVSHILQAEPCPIDVEKQYRGARSGLSV